MTTRNTSSSRRGRPELLESLDGAVRRMGAQSVLLSDLVAARVGLNSTDLECLDLLYLAGVTTAGRLSAHTGLTSGATTAAIDRLEHAGFVARRRDPRDRRVVLVEVVETGAKLIYPFYRPLAKRMDKFNALYPATQLVTVLRYLTDALEATAEHVAWLQTQPALSRRRCRHPMTADPVRPGTPLPTQRQGVARRASRRAAAGSHS